MSIDYENMTHDDLLNMSEEDFAKLDPSKLVDKEPEPEHQPQDQGQEEVTTPPADVAQEPAPVEEVEQPTTPDAEPTSEGVPSVVEGEAEQPAGTVPNEEGEAGKEQPATPTAEVKVAPEKEFFDKVTAEFKANGKAFKIDSAEDVISLMQKGLNYNQRMANMKPGMKVLKALQEQGIESVEDLGFLFDLKNRNPQAIAKLIQESGIDTYDLGEDKAVGYQPSVPQVDDAVINFEMVSKSLEGNPHFGTLVGHMPSFDDQTKQQIFANPGLMNVLTDHIASGQFYQICARLDHERAVGRLAGVPFLDAYDKVGHMLFAQPAPTQAVPAPVVQPAPVPTPVATPVASKANTSNNAARQAAAGTPSTATQVQKTNYTPEDIWNMSDDEFAKIDPKFLV